MSLFDEANADAYTIAPDQGAAGPQLGFQAAFSASWDLQTKVNSQLGMEHSFRAVEQAQMKRMRDAGLEPHKGLDDSDVGGGGPFSSSIFKQGRYNAAAQSIVDGGGWYTDEMVAERNAHIKREQELHPDLGLQTYDEMFKGLQDEATKTVARSNLPTTALGTVGSLAGSMAGAIDPTVNPINAATLPIVGGGGVLGRMAVQGVAQAGAETADIALNDNRRLLTGVEPTAGENLGRIVTAAAGGAAFEGAATALGAGFRKLTTGKWFHDLPIDKGPPPKDVPPSSPMDDTTPHAELMQPGRPIGDYPDFETFARAHGYEPPIPYGPTREARARHAIDLDYATRELDKWDGPAPWELPPRTDTALPQGVEPGVRYDTPYQRYVDNLDTPADIARRMDPDLFRTYDALAGKIEELRKTIERVQTLPDMRPNAARPDFQLEHAISIARREQELRLELQQVDQRMRDLAPNVSRAMGAAENEWRHTPLDTATLTFLKGLEERTGWRYRGEDKPSLTEQPMKPRPAPAAVVPRTIADAVPQSVLSPERQAKQRPNADASDRIAINTTEDMAAVHEKVAAFVKTARTNLAMDAAELKAAQAAVEKELRAQEGSLPRAQAGLVHQDAATREHFKGQVAALETRIAELHEKLDELTGITLPNGARLKFDETVHGPDGNEMSVRDYLAEMDKNQHALDAVTTCSRPS